MQLLDMALLQTLFRELACRRGFERIPERDLAMINDEAVNGFTAAGEAEGSMAGFYLYHLSHICEVILPADTVLDMACGPATLLSQVATLNPNIRFIGADLSEQMLAKGRDAIQRQRLGNVELRVEDMTKLETIGDKSVDAVISTVAFHHLPDEESLEKTFETISRVLRPRGGVYLCDFGRLKSPQSVEYFVRRATWTASHALAQDYERSLRAAFSKAQIATAAKRNLDEGIRVCSTPISPFLVVIKSPNRRSIDHLKPLLRERARKLPLPAQKDLRQMKFFLRLGGLRNVI